MERLRENADKRKELIGKLAIIPARSGSKGLPDKNIREINGKPLLAYSIEAATESNIFDEVMVSVDSCKYADIARQYGAKVPFYRSKETSSDKATSWDAVFEILENYRNIGKEFESFCLLQPTSPLRNSYDIANAYKIFDEKGASAVVSLVELDHPLSWCGTVSDSGSIENFIPSERMARRQIQTKYYRPNGAIYIQKTLDFLNDRYLYRKDSYAYIMPKERSVDIDTEFDFRFAEFLMKSVGVNDREEL